MNKKERKELIVKTFIWHQFNDWIGVLDDNSKNFSEYFEKKHKINLNDVYFSINNAKHNVTMSDEAIEIIWNYLQSNPYILLKFT